jgi:hypothetical protein
MSVYRLLIYRFFTATITCDCNAKNTSVLYEKQLTLAIQPSFFLKKYYTYGTAGNNSNNGIPVYSSRDVFN